MRIRLASEKFYLFSYFIGLIVVGTVALSLPAAWGGAEPLSLVDAFFTASSAVCVTGLVTVDFTQFSRLGQSIAAVLIQLGGLGYVSFAAIYVATPRTRMSLAGRSIIRDMSIDEVEHNPRRIIRAVILVTVSIELIGAALLYSRFKAAGSKSPIFEAVFHSVSGFCNAGFSTRRDSLESFAGDPASCAVIMTLIGLGGIGFTVLQDLWRVAVKSRRRLSYHTRVVLAASAALFLAGTAFFLYSEREGAYSGLSPLDKVVAAAFQSASPRTAGFDTIAQSTLHGSSIVAILLLMFIGASPGSTGGGIKTTTFFVALSALVKDPSAGSGALVWDRQIGPALFMKAFSVILRAVAIVAIAWIGLSLTESTALRQGTLTMSTLLFEAVSAFGTVGLSLGATAVIGDGAKLVLIATMLAGRIGLFAMALPKGERAVERWAEMPDATLMIG
jgi:trk system potassium uptake protein